MADLIAAGSTNQVQSNLFRKYMPTIRAKSKCNTLRSQARTMIGKWVASNHKFSYKQYRHFKRNGTAHVWQQLISQKRFDKIDFGSVHGRALLQMVSSKFLENQGLTKKYEEWIESQPVAKFTGYVHELAMKIGAPNMCGSRNRYRKAVDLKPYQKKTINKQYDGLVRLAKSDENITKLLVVRDTSSSMTSNIPGQDFSAYDVAKALGIFFGDMLDGPFKNSWLEFSNSARIHTYKASNFVDKWLGDTSEAYGGTNFQGVMEFFSKVKSDNVDESHFPSGILCISDGEFNSTGMRNETNVQAFKRGLLGGGFSREFVDNFKIVFWDIRNSYYGKRNASFETYDNHENVFYMSGYDGTVVSFFFRSSDICRAPAGALQISNGIKNISRNSLMAKQE